MIIIYHENLVKKVLLNLCFIIVYYINRKSSFSILSL